MPRQPHASASTSKWPTLFTTNALAVSGKIWETVAAMLTPAERAKVQALAKDPAVLAEVQRDVDSAMQAKVPSTPHFHHHASAATATLEFLGR